MRPWRWIGTEHWPLPVGIRAMQTLRQPPGRPVPAQPEAGFNLSERNASPALTAARRRCLVSEAGLASMPLWLNQVHGTRVVEACDLGDGKPVQADAIVARSPGQVCAILTADCLPVLMARRDGTAVAAVHAGWRGLASSILEHASEALGGEQIAWLGPCIGPEAFEVGPEVRQAFLAHGDDAAAHFRPGRGDRWWADLAGLARQRLTACGVACFGVEACTFHQPERFYSHRRDPRSGRQASLIWLF